MISRSKIKKIFPILFLLAIIFLVAEFFPSWAQSPSPTATPATKTATAESEAVEAIRKDLEEKIQEELKTTNQQKRGYFGKIADLYNQSIILETPEGKITAKVDQESSLIDQERKKIKFEDLAIGDYLVVMGFGESTETLLTKRLVVTLKPKEVNRIALIGRVEKMSKDKLTIQSLKKSTSSEVIITNKTEVAQKVDGKIDEVDFSEIEEQTLVVIAGTEKDNQTEAKVVYLLAEKNTSPTPSISSSPSESAKPTRSSTPTKEPTPTQP